jgi:hypothetical protein
MEGDIEEVTKVLAELNEQFAPPGGTWTDPAAFEQALAFVADNLADDSGLRETLKADLEAQRKQNRADLEEAAAILDARSQRK